QWLGLSGHDAHAFGPAGRDSRRRALLGLPANEGSRGGCRSRTVAARVGGTDAAAGGRRGRPLERLSRFSGTGAAYRRAGQTRQVRRAAFGPPLMLARSPFRGPPVRPLAPTRRVR